MIDYIHDDCAPNVTGTAVYIIIALILDIYTNVDNVILLI